MLVGKNLLLTAEHAAPWCLPGRCMRFVPAQKTGSEPFGSFYVESYRGFHKDKDGEVNGKCYVICKLFTPQGITLGWMVSRLLGNDDKKYPGSWRRTHPVWHLESRFLSCRYQDWRILLGRSRPALDNALASGKLSADATVKDFAVENAGELGDKVQEAWEEDGYPFPEAKDEL